MSDTGPLAWFPRSMYSEHPQPDGAPLRAPQLSGEDGRAIHRCQRAEGFSKSPDPWVGVAPATDRSLKTEQEQPKAGASGFGTARPALIFERG